MDDNTAPNAAKVQPLILAIDTATLHGSVALVKGDKCIAEMSVDSKSTFSKRLLKYIDFLLDETYLNLQALDALAVSMGPGSFTGLRIGLATVKGLSYSANVPLIGVSTLLGLANQVPFSDYLICPLIDARKKQVYCGFYRKQTPLSPPVPISSVKNLAINDLLNIIDEPTLFLGDGMLLYRQEIELQLGKQAFFAKEINISASSIGLLAAGKWTQQDFLNTDIAIPDYVRKSDAELYAKRGISEKG